MRALLLLLLTATLSAAGLKVGDPAPATRPEAMLQGEAVKDFKKGEVYVFECWASWCGPCVAALPEVPTFMESGLTDFEINSWVALLAPAKTPKAIVDRLNTELNAVLNDPEARDKLNGMGITATPGTPEKFGEEMKRDLARYGQVVKAANIKAE